MGNAWINVCFRMQVHAYWYNKYQIIDVHIWTCSYRFMRKWCPFAQQALGVWSLTFILFMGLLLICASFVKIYHLSWLFLLCLHLAVFIYTPPHNYFPPSTACLLLLTITVSLCSSLVRSHSHHVFYPLYFMSIKILAIYYDLISGQELFPLLYRRDFVTDYVWLCRSKSCRSITLTHLNPWTLTFLTVI